MSNNFFEKYKRIAILIGVLFLIIPLCPSIGEEGIADPNIVRLVYSGKFQEALKKISPASSAPTNQPANLFLSQLKKFDRILNEREEMREMYYGLDVKKAHTYLDKKDIEKALTAARKAKYYAKDQKTFGKQQWVLNIRKEAEKKAQNYLAKHEWLKAGNIFAELATIYDDDKTFEKSTKDCALRVRLQATYKPKSEWSDQVKGIKIDVIPDVLSPVSSYYVEKPDFSKMAKGGLQNMQLMLEIPKLSEVFPGFTDKAKTKEFGNELKKLIAQIDEQSKKQFTYRDFWQVFVRLMIINDESCDIPDEVLIREFLDSAMAELDPFTSVIWPAEMEDFEKHTTGRFSGVGIQLSMENSKLTVITPMPGTPAYKAGVVPGDIISSINGESTEGITIDQAVRKITGPKSTKVRLGILHPWTDKELELTLTRDTIMIQTVKGYRMDKNNRWSYFVDAEKTIGYIRLTSFTDTSLEELESALTQIHKSDPKGLIFDLRFDPGGTLKAAVETVDLFINKGVIVSTKGRSVEPWTKSASSGGTYFGLPMIVLVNGFSASAAEIVSGALKDYHRALVIGERSFGKGSVQNVLPIVGDTLKLKLTTAYYYLPSGRCLHKKTDSKEWGVDPDVKMELMPYEQKDVVDLQREAEIVTQVNGMNVDTIPTTRKQTQNDNASTTTTSTADEDEFFTTTQPRKFPAVDVQLEAAITIMRARIDSGLQFFEKQKKPTTAASDFLTVQSNNTR